MKQILILSGKGGTGKTTTAAAFIAFSQAKAMADCDVDAPNLHLVTKFKNTAKAIPFYGGKKAQINVNQCISCGKCLAHCRFHAIKEDYTIDEYACEGCGVCQYVCENDAIELAEDIAGTQFLYEEDRVFSTATLKMGIGNSGKLVSQVKLEMQKRSLDFPLAIIDGTPGIGCPVIASMSGVDYIVCVCEPSISSLSDLKRLVRSAQAFKTKMGILVNKWEVSQEYTELIEAYAKEESITILGRIPYDLEVVKATNRGESITTKTSKAAIALYAAYLKVMQEIKMEE